MASLKFDLDGDTPMDLRATPTPVLELPEAAVFEVGNRRFLPRQRRAFSVRIESENIDLFGVDLSFGGMMCRGPLVWPGNVVEAELQLPEEKAPIALKVRVVEMVSRKGQMCMRMRFESPDSQARKRIARWMSAG